MISPDLKTSSEYVSELTIELSKWYKHYNFKVSLKYHFEKQLVLKGKRIGKNGQVIWKRFLNRPYNQRNNS